MKPNQVILKDVRGPLFGNVITALAVILSAGCGNKSSEPALAAQEPVVTKGIAFVSCPQFRDVGNSILANSCWVAENKGTLYSLDGGQGTPQLGHSVLVEAEEVDASATVCKGQVLKGVRVSVLPELDASCETILPADGVQLAAPSGPPPGTTAPTIPPTPYQSTDYVIEFPHQSWNIGTIGSSASVLVETAANLAKLGNAKQVVVTGHAMSTRLSDGSVLMESAALAQQRAERVALALHKLQVPDAIVQTTWDTNVGADGGADAWKGRTVTISVKL